jgi:hypothetical protein
MEMEFSMKVSRSWVLIVAALLNSAVGVLCQEPHGGAVLEVVQTTDDIHRNETMVYLRVYADGLAEAHSDRVVDFRNIDLKRKRLPPEELNRLRQLLDADDTQKLNERYERFWGARDFSTEWRITMVAKGKNREMALVNFQPFLAREKHQNYPPQLESLGCSIWRLRVEVTGEPLDRNYVAGCQKLGL